MDKIFRQILDARPDPLNVLKSTAYVVEHARYVKIDRKAIARTANTLVDKQTEPPTWNYDYHFHDGSPRTVNYLFLLDALNFCFWGKPKWDIEYVIASRKAAKQSPTKLGTLAPHVTVAELRHSHVSVATARKTRFAMTVKLDGYWALAASLKRAAEKNPQILEAEFMARITPEQLGKILPGNTTIPLFTERWRNVRELGTVLKNLWGGQAARFVECAKHNAAQLAQMITENLSSFNDIAVYDNCEVRLFKRAQILVADLWGAFDGKAWGEFGNIDVLTAFADYKLPQILRAWGILKYAPSLARKVDAQIEIAAGSPEEIEIRAAMLWAVEFLRDALANRGRHLRSTQVDWILWEASQATFKGMKPYHRVRTIYY